MSNTLDVPAHPLSAACYYAQRGWPVFPCNTQKQPRTKRGFLSANTDTDAIRTHWAEHPDDTIGIATGPALGSNLLVIDLDSYKLGGHPEWDALVREHGPVPQTFTVQTGQGGTQIYFTTEEPIRSRTDVSPNVDARCDGGYVIAAPSRTVYGEYIVIDDAEPVPAPEWVLAYVRRAEVALRDSSAVDTFDHSTLTDGDRARLRGYTERAVEGEVSRLRAMRTAATADGYGYAGDPWDQTTYEVACNLIELANSPWNELSERDVHDALLREAPRDAGFTDADVLAKWNSARKTVADRGRTMPANPTQGGYFTPTPSGGDGGVIDPDAFFEKGKGLVATMLAQAVLDMGPLAIEDNDTRSIWAYRRGVWAYAPNEIMNRCTVLLGPRFRPNHVTVIEPIVQQRAEATGARITSEPAADYINVLDGMLHWSTGVLYPHDPSFLSTVQLPVKWEPSAVCPRFDDFARSIMAPDALPYLWEILGYMIFSGNPFQRAILFHGAGSNGKGTLIRVLQQILGQQNISAVTLQDIAEGKFETASLFGKIANLAGDIDASYMKSTAKFKQITGEDTIQAQRKFQGPFHFKCWATPLFSANEFWKSADTTTGYKRRWLLVPFPNTFKINAGFSESFADELPGILAHAVASLRVLMERGDFDEPASAKDEKDRFELAADQVAEWLREDDLIIVADPKNTGAYIAASDAYRTYRTWCDSTGNGPLPAQRFRQRLSSLGYDIRKSGVTKIYGLQVARNVTRDGVPVF